MVIHVEVDDKCFASREQVCERVTLFALACGMPRLEQWSFFAPYIAFCSGKQSLLVAAVFLPLRTLNCRRMLEGASDTYAADGGD